MRFPETARIAAACLFAALTAAAQSQYGPLTVGNDTFTNSTTSETTVTVIAPATVQVTNFVTRITASLNGGSNLYDQSFNVAFSDPTVQAAVTQAQGILTTAGATSITGPALVSNNTVQQSSVTSVVNTTVGTNTTTTTATVIGPGTMLYGSNESLTFMVGAGDFGFNTNTDSDTFVNQQSVTTNTNVTTQVYSLTGVAGPAPVIASVVNTYNAQSGLSPGTVATITGANFGSIAANVTVSVGGKNAYLYPASVTPAQLQIEIPMELAAGPTTVIVTVSGVPSNAFAITLATYAPTCQPQDSSGSGLGKIFTTATGLVTLTTPAHPSDSLSIIATGLGATNPPTATGLAAAANATATLPSITIGGATATVASAVAVAGSAGVYQINFTVPVGVQGTQPLVISVGTTSASTTCNIALAGLSSIVNNASFANPGVASPGSIATAFANALGTTTDQLTKLFPANSSEGVQVTFNGEAAPMFHIVASTPQQQVDLLVPTDLPTSGTVNVQLNGYPDYTLNMVPANPGLYRIPDPKVSTRFNVIAQFNNTTWLALPASTTTALGLPACTKTTGALVTCGQPATAKDILVIYVTGLGLATPSGSATGKPLATGQVAPADTSVLYETPTLPTVTVGGVAAQVYFSGLAPGFAGLYQIDIQVPDGVANGDDVPVKVTMLGASDTATISIQPRP